MCDATQLKFVREPTEALPNTTARLDLGGKRRRGGSALSKHDEGNADTCDPQALGHRLIGAETAGVDELNVNGRQHNRPVPSKEGCSNQGV